MALTQTHTLDEVQALILADHVLLLAGEESVLCRLPPGRWIGGTAAHFISPHGGEAAGDRILVTDITSHVETADIRAYSAQSIPGLAADYPANGFSSIAIPGLSEVHATFARDGQSYEGLFNSPLVGWITASDLDDPARRTPKCFVGDGVPRDDVAAVMHVTLPAGQSARTDIINPFAIGDGPTFEFDDEGFVIGPACAIDGRRDDFTAYLAAHPDQIRLPLVADYRGALVNVSIRSCDAQTGRIEFFAPVTRGVTYRFAAAPTERQNPFAAACGLTAPEQVAASCNCILNYSYFDLKGRAAGPFFGPVSFGEIAYILFNQTLTFLVIEEVAADAEILKARAERARRWSMVSRCIDERLQARQALEQAKARAEAANHAKDDFLANVSHEIRTPMTGIMGMAHLLLNEDLTSQQKKFVQAIDTSAKSLLTIINDLLDMSKLEAGKVELESVPFGLESLLGDVVQLFAPRAEQKGLEFTCNLDDVARTHLVGDPTRLRQVLLNLVSNALKFTEQGFVSVSVSALAPTATGLPLRIAVEDSGPGVADEAKHRLFEKFEQADGSISRRYGGTGLGLSICRSLIELMGGDIGMSDGPGGGSIFWIELTLPALPDAPDVRPPASAIASAKLDRRPSEPEGALVRRKILLAEDNAINVLIATTLLESAGYEVEAVSNGAQALASAASHTYGLVLMDVNMPVLDGLEATRRIRTLGGEAARVPIVAMTAGVTQKERDACLLAGMDGFVSKPFEPQVFVDTISHHMQGNHRP